MGSNIHPEQGTYKNVSGLRYWTQKVLPLVYDDSLSYSELLAKVVAYLNAVIENSEVEEENIANLLLAFNELQSYVNEYLASGEFVNQLEDTVEAWFNEHPDAADALRQANLALQKSEQALSNSESAVRVSGGASELANTVNQRMNNIIADGQQTEGNTELIDIRTPVQGIHGGVAYATAGEAVRGQVSSLKEDLTELSETVIGIPLFNFIEEKNLNDDGTIGYDATACVSDKIPYTWTGDTRYYCNDNTTTKYAICFYDSSDNLLKKVQLPSATGGVEYRAYNADNAAGTVSYVRFSFKKGTVGRCVKNQNPEPTDYWTATAMYDGGLVDDVADLQENAPEPGQMAKIDEDLNGGISYNYETGKNLDANGLSTDDNNSCVSEFIPYTWTGDTRYYYGEQSSGYRICFYDSTKTLLMAFQSVYSENYRAINAENSVTGTVAYVRFSFKKNTAAKVTKNVASALPQYWKTKTTVVVGLKERTSKIEKNTVTDFQSYVKSISASLENSTLTAVQNIDVRKNDIIECKGMITSFTSLTIGHGYQINHGMWAVIDGTNITTYKDESGTQVAQQAHGLTIGDYIGVVIKRGENNRADIELTTSSGRYVWQNVVWSANRGNVFATVSGTLTNVSLSYVMRDLNSNILVFGDSYQSLGDSARWPYYCISNGFDKFLACGFPGANSEHEIISFRNLIELIKPKFVVWALGMNDSDSGAVNETWKECVDEVVATCTEYGITPILATIPCVPNRNHTYKNAYMKTLNKRYIDFAKAVNAESAGATWYTGMLSTDNLHPTALGAMALYSQVLEDFPEIMS